MILEDIPTKNVDGTATFEFEESKDADLFTDFIKKSNYYDETKTHLFYYRSKTTRVALNLRDWEGLDDFYQIADALVPVARHYHGTFSSCSVICKPPEASNLQGKIPALRLSEVEKDFEGE